jgi:hypothetical protein
MKTAAALVLAAWAGAAAAQTPPPPSASSPAAPAMPARTPQPPAPADAASIDAVVRALYTGVSHAPDQEPDWSHLRTIFLPGGRFVPPQRPTGEFLFLSTEDFIERMTRGIAARKAQGQPAGFSEREIARKTDCFGNICQLFSTYESRYTAADSKPFARGINAIQVVREGNRWWIVNVLWDQEGSEKPIPAAYLPKP